MESKREDLDTEGPELVFQQNQNHLVNPEQLESMSSLRHYNPGLQSIKVCAQEANSQVLRE